MPQFDLTSFLADDTNVFASHKSCDDAFQLMHQELYHANDWFTLN